MRTRPFAVLVAAALLLGSPAIATGDTILMFDDVTTGTYAYPLQAYVPDYGGLTWSSHFGVLKGADLGGGYANGVVSGDYVGYTGAASVDVTGPSFDFVGAYFTAAWVPTLDVLVQGYLGGSLLYSQTVVAGQAAPTWFAFNYIGIDDLRIAPAGNQNLAIDNFTYAPTSAVPEPATLLLVGAGIAGLKGIRVRRKAR